MTKSPAIILVHPQMGENIGAAARVMLNFGLTDLRLVAPRDGWPNEAAVTMSAGALPERVEARVYANAQEAIASLSYVYATTARPRDMVKPVFDASGAVKDLTQRDGQVGILFGAERSGLPNDVVTLADAILTYPVNTEFASLNLAQAVAVFAHTFAEAEASVPDAFERPVETATKADFLAMMDHLRAELEHAGFFHPASKTELMMQNLTNAFARGEWTEQEVRTFRGVIKSLAKGRVRNA